MRKVITIALLAVSMMAQAQDVKTRVIDNAGSGEFKAVMATDQSLPTHTIFKPQDLSKFGGERLLPVLVWGNGACANSPWEHVNFLNEIASHGYLVIAIGPMPEEGVEPEGKTESKQLIEAIDWAEKQNADPESQYFGKIDVTKVAAAGMSCGGLQTLDICEEPRLRTMMICNSGLFVNREGTIPGVPMPTKDKLKQIHTPVLYMLGGKIDIAYVNGMDDFQRIDHVPVFACNLEVGHGGTYSKPFGGEYGIVATAWLDWQLKGDQEAAKMFVGDDCGLSKREGWTFESKLRQGKDCCGEKAQVVIDNIMSRRSIQKYKEQAVPRETLDKIMECGINAPNGSRSIQKYKEQAVPRETLDKIMECGINAPNGMNQQNYEVKVVDDAASVKFLSENLRGLYKAPVYIFIAAGNQYDMSRIDVGLLSENICLAANAYGLGTINLGQPVRALKDKPEILQKLGFGENYDLCLVLALGYPDETPVAKPRKKDKVQFVKVEQ